MRAGAQGTAKLGVHITAEGAIGSVDILQSTGNRDLDETAAACVMQRWRFYPAMLDGKPVARSGIYAIKFALQ